MKQKQLKYIKINSVNAWIKSINEALDHHQKINVFFDDKQHKKLLISMIKNHPEIDDSMKDSLILKFGSHIFKKNKHSIIVK